ncbi:hypothetical protein PIB30_033033 [Stylosanthes scabra]|uniref:Uncharacterized protein n=1 Tax=Stylosanthes scabra TaxID=79078 RepID=A0ABU6WDC5_9FABA|nr:hypothetical protein [Stylosanthes scabra]
MTISKKHDSWAFCRPKKHALASASWGLRELLSLEQAAIRITPSSSLATNPKPTTPSPLMAASTFTLIRLGGGRIHLSELEAPGGTVLAFVSAIAIALWYSSCLDVANSTSSNGEDSIPSKTNLFLAFHRVSRHEQNNPCKLGSNRFSNSLIHLCMLQSGFSADRIVKGMWNQNNIANSQILKRLTLVGKELLRILHVQLMVLG